MLLKYLSNLRESFIENIRPILTDLERFNDDELFYQRCYELRSDPKAFADYISSFDEFDLKKRKLIIPGKKKLSIITEYDLFGGSEKRNVLICKHNCYTPAFKHYHNYFEILYVLSGQCVNAIEDRRFTMSPGSLCFIAPYINHSLEVFSNCIVLNICTRKSSFDEIFFNLLTTDDVLSDFFIGNIYSSKPVKHMIFETGDDGDLIEILFSMLIEQSGDDEYSGRVMDDLGSLFFTHIIRNHGKTRRFTNDYAEQYMAYINDQFRTVSLSDVAKHFGVSRAHCSRLIKSLTGRNFTDLARDIRLRHARSLLTSSNIKIRDISYSLGYENQETFIRNFKKAYGVSPGKYRASASSFLNNPKEP